MRTRLIPWLVLASLFAGCGGLQGQRRALPSWCPQAHCPGVPADPARTVVVHSGADRCVWVLVDGRQVDALWPPGYSVTYGPLKIFDEAGTVIAQDGTELEAVIIGPQPAADVEGGCHLGSVVQIFLPERGVGEPSAG